MDSIIIIDNYKCWHIFLLRTKLSSIFIFDLDILYPCSLLSANHPHCIPHYCPILLNLCCYLCLCWCCFYRFQCRCHQLCLIFLSHCYTFCFFSFHPNHIFGCTYSKSTRRTKLENKNSIKTTSKLKAQWSGIFTWNWLTGQLIR